MGPLYFAIGVAVSLVVQAAVPHVIDAEPAPTVRDHALGPDMAWSQSRTTERQDVQWREKPTAHVGSGARSRVIDATRSDGVCVYMQKKVADLLNELTAESCALDPWTIENIEQWLCDRGHCRNLGAGVNDQRNDWNAHVAPTTSHPATEPVPLCEESADSQWKVTALLLAAISTLSMILLVVARSQIALLQFEKSRERGPNAGRQRTRSRSGSGGSNAGPSLYANPAHTRHETPPRRSTGAPLQTVPGVRPMRHRPSVRERSVPCEEEMPS
mmetsp:Transcript_25686/g.37871  ORF Transcript_25686/g.37871 Transcript_25686/m.37871 type:complete len:272 (-) Transcript_25686:42-857(-)|eukprot:CAMPEP_0195522238 /NCGR_PEP_ID=MMETSP0794_2-20130614/20183_1 /TAXON_ID=515487 /ORGANISM="Stephanopyxis turris, Strain CCMP 815" /LENGTH=271 /DNA_ID=CAMNT_0040651945 /DNA_START=97 /DNA_END=912 /DNA_ORIENTATION=+